MAIPDNDSRRGRRKGGGLDLAEVEECFLQPTRQLRFIRDLALPHNHGSPAEGSQGAQYPLVSGHVLFKLRRPEREITLWRIRETASGMSVPEAPMNEHDGAMPRQHHVWPSRKFHSIKSESKSEAMKNRANE
jgi:hypothetical protein